MSRNRVRRSRRRRAGGPDAGDVLSAFGGSAIALAAQEQQGLRPLDQLLEHLFLMVAGGALAEWLGGPRRGNVFIWAYLETLKGRSNSPGLAT